MLKLVKSYKKSKDISCIVVLVAFNTFDWIESCLTGLRRVLPKIDVLVVDNNPCQNTKRSESFDGYTVYGNPVKWSRYNEDETKWLKSVKDELNFQLVQTPWFMSHGHAVDFAVRGLSKHDTFVHIEPDCKIHGSKWLKALKQKIAKGDWMASGHRWPSKEIHPTPSIWRLDVWRHLNLSFTTFPRTIFAEQERIFYKMVNVHKMFREHQHNWDTGIYASYRCARRGRASCVETTDFWHRFRGSTDRKIKNRLAKLQKIF